MIEWIGFFTMGLIALFFLSRFVGFKKGTIVLTFDQRYTDFGRYVENILKELKRKDHEAKYIGNRIFLIDEEEYELVDQNRNFEAASIQQTILRKVE